MSLLHQQLLESIQEAESIRKSREYASQLTNTLEEQEQAYKVLEKKLAKEQRDADTLEQESVTTWLHKFIGDREEKLEKEQEEYLKASTQHLELYKSIELIRYELKILKEKGNTLDNAEMKVVDLMNEREKELILSDPKIAGSIKNINRDTNHLQSQINKIEKLIKTGEKALISINNIEKNLNDAQEYRNNRNPGSGILAYEEIGNAHHLVSKTIPVLNRFQNDLTSTYADIQLGANIRFAMFAQYSGIISTRSC